MPFHLSTLLTLIFQVPDGMDVEEEAFASKPTAAPSLARNPPNEVDSNAGKKRKRRRPSDSSSSESHDKQNSDDSGVGDDDVGTAGTSEKNGPPATCGTGDEPQVDPQLLHDLIIRKYAPPIKRIKCLCGAKNCCGFLF